MLKRIPMRAHHLKRIGVWVVLDTTIILLAYIVAFSLRAVTTSLEPLYSQALFGIFINTVIIANLYMAGVYYRIWSKTSGDEIAIILRAIIFATLIIVIVNVIPDHHPLPMSVILSANVFIAGGLSLTRYRSRLFTSWRWRTIWKGEVPESLRNVHNVLIVGAGESGIHVAKRLRQNGATKKHHIVGFIDDDPDKQGVFMESSQIVGTRQDIPRITAQNAVDIIIIAIHNIEGPDFRDILTFCEETKAVIKVVPDMIADVNAIKGAPIIRDLSAEDYIGRKQIDKHEDIDFSPIEGKCVLVTGAAGSIGSELAHQIMNYAPTKVLLLDVNESGLYDLLVDLNSLYPQTKDRIELILADVTRCEQLKAVFEQYKPEVIFHAAAYKHVPFLEDYPHQAVNVNVQGTLNIVQLATKHHVDRFVLISTDKAVEPVSVMGMTKRICELIILSAAKQNGHKTLFTAVRFGNVLGSRGSVVPIFTRQIDAGGPVTLTDKNMRRYFMSIREAVNLIIHASCLTEGSDLFMLRMGEEVNIYDLAKRMIRMRGLRPDVDIPIKVIGLRPGEKLTEELRSDHEIEHNTLHPDIVKLEITNGYSEGDIDNFLNRVEDFLGNYYPNGKTKTQITDLIKV